MPTASEHSYGSVRSDTLSNDRTRVRIEYHGEHHMGAEHVRVVIDPPLAQSDQFQGTNIAAMFSNDGRFLIVHDSCVVLVFECDSCAVGHMLPPPGWYFTNVRLLDENVTVGLYGSRGRNPPSYGPFELSRIVREGAGTGPVRNGRMPSLYEPCWVEARSG